VELIISHLIYDMHTLITCSATCYSWYIAAVPHLHHTLTIDDDYVSIRLRKKYIWPRPLRNSYKLGLLPLVKQFRIRMGSRQFNQFTPKWLGRRTLSYFSALTNLQELGIDYLQVSSFMPNIRRRFGHLAPTLRFLALKEPKGSCRQILYFIGLFPNLQDLKLHYSLPRSEQESAADETLVPLSTPPLRGRLTLTCFTRETLLKEMIFLFGGLPFRQMDLFGVKCVRLLLDACVDTLETLRLYPTDVCGEEFLKRRWERTQNEGFIEDHALLRHFNLSRNKSLRVLETTGESIYAAGYTASNFLKAVLSSITPSVPLDVVIIYRDRDICGLASWTLEPECLGHSSQRVWDSKVADYQQQLRVLREMYKTRDFRLVLCADVPYFMVEHALEILRRIVEEGKVMGGLGHLYEPLVVCERRTLHTRYGDPNPGCLRGWYVPATAL
jgi:hypothetical protein